MNITEKVPAIIKRFERDKNYQFEVIYLEIIDRIVFCSNSGFALYDGLTFERIATNPIRRIRSKAVLLLEETVSNVLLCFIRRYIYLYWIEKSGFGKSERLNVGYDLNLVFENNGLLFCLGSNAQTNCFSYDAKKGVWKSLKFQFQSENGKFTINFWNTHLIAKSRKSRNRFYLFHSPPPRYDFHFAITIWEVREKSKRAVLVKKLNIYDRLNSMQALVRNKTELLLLSTKDNYRILILNSKKGNVVKVIRMNYDNDRCFLNYSGGFVTSSRNFIHKYETKSNFKRVLAYRMNYDDDDSVISLCWAYRKGEILLIVVTQLQGALAIEFSHKEKYKHDGSDYRERIGFVVENENWMDFAISVVNLELNVTRIFLQL